MRPASRQPRPGRCGTTHSFCEAQVGLPIRAAYLWELAEGTPVPTEITVIINGSIRRYQNFRYLGTTIEDEEPKATVTLPVVNRTGAV